MLHEILYLLNLFYVYWRTKFLTFLAMFISFTTFFYQILFKITKKLNKCLSYSVIISFPQTAIKMSLINLPAFTDKE